MFLHANREAGALAGELSEESAQFLFIRATCLVNLNISIGLMLSTVLTMVTIPLDLSTRSFISLSRFIRTRNTTLLTPSLVLFTQSSA